MRHDGLDEEWGRHVREVAVEVVTPRFKGPKGLDRPISLHKISYRTFLGSRVGTPKA